MAATNGQAAEISHLKERVNKSEDDRAEIWRHQGSLEKSLAVLGERVEGLTAVVEGLTDELKSTKRAMWSLVVGSFAVVVSLATLIIQ